MEQNHPENDDCEFITPLFSSVSEEETETKEIVSKEYDTLVLSGGGIKCFILLGALQYFYDKHSLRNVSTYVGTSIGSVISFLLSIGYTPIELLISLQMNKWLENLDNTFNVLNILNEVGVVSWSKIQESLESLTINKIGYYPTLRNIYEKFGKRLVFVTYNFTKRETEYLDYINCPDLPCLVGLRMSCNIPLVFDKFKYMGSFYVDGALGDNFAILKGSVLSQQYTPPRKTLGICLKYEKPEEEKELSLNDNPSSMSIQFQQKNTNILDYVLALMQIPISAAIKFRISLVEDDPLCDILQINTHALYDISFVKFNISSKEKLDMFSLGYQAAKNETFKK